MTHGGPRSGAGRRPVAGTTKRERFSLVMTTGQRGEIESEAPVRGVGPWIVDAAVERARRLRAMRERRAR